MQFITTGWYAAVLTAGFVVLSLRTASLRRRLRVALGDGGHEALARAVRMHANFAEYLPWALVLMLMAEVQGAPVLLLHAAGVALVLGRLLNAHALNGATRLVGARPMGLALTLAACVSLAAYSPLSSLFLVR